MSTRARIRPLLLGLGLGLGLAVVACSGGIAPVDPAPSSSSSSGASSSGTTPEPTPQEQISVAPPTTSLEVTATIVAATLGDECGGGGFAPGAGDCAPTPDGKGCGSICRESNVQLSFKTGAGDKSTVEVVAVTLHDGKTGSKLDTLKASDPQSWTGSTYAPWDQTLSPSSELKASYDLTAPAWSTIGSGTAYGNYSAEYRLRVSLRIDGALVVLESALLSREPAVAT
jgi:hypothetical protein